MAPVVESTLEVVGMAVPVFRVGPPQRPPIKHDDGFLGKFPPRQPTPADYAQLSTWIARLEAGEAIQGIPFLPKNDLPDALAIGAHYLWMSAGVTGADNGIHTAITMQLTLHVEDRYNFNPDNEDIATGIPDEANGKFELTGLGHQYTNYSTLSRMVRWTALSPETVSGLAAVPHDGRHRRPTDNRRLRNRL